MTPTNLPTRHNIIVVLTICRYLQRKQATETSRQSAHFVQKLFFLTSVNITAAVGMVYNIYFGNAEHVPVSVPIPPHHGTPASPAAIVVIYYHYHYIVHYVLAVYHTAIVPIYTIRILYL